MKMTNKLIITKRTTVTKMWRHKLNLVFLASSNNDERTCRESRNPGGSRRLPTLRSQRKS